MTDWRLGQIVYVAETKTMRIVPVRVVEVTSRQTLKGEVRTYRVQKSKDPSDVVDLMDLKTNMIFGSLEEAEKELVDRLTSFVHRSLDQARRNAFDWYETSESVDDVRTSIPQMTTSDEYTEVMMPDGTIVRAKVKLPVT